MLVLQARMSVEDKAFPTVVSCSFPDVGEPAAVGKRCALFALQRDVRGLRATFLEVTSCPRWALP